MPPPRNHDENRLAVCLLCMNKTKEMTKITTNMQETINIYFLEGYNSDDIRLPSALCGNCRHIVQEYRGGKFVKKIEVFDYSEIGTMPRPITRSGVQCQCKICEVGRSNFLTIGQARRKSPGRPSTDNNLGHSQSPPKPIRICSFCLTILSRGKPHQCDKYTRHHNLLQIPNTEIEKDQIASSILRQKSKAAESNSPILKLTTITGKPMTVNVSPSTSSNILFTSDDISAIQLDLNLSYNQTLKLAAHIRSSTKARKSIEPGLKQKLSEKRHLLDQFFSASEVEYLKIHKDKITEKESKPTVFCTDFSGMIEYVIGKRGQIENENLRVKLCLDGGGGFMKICLSVFNTVDDFQKKHRRTYDEGMASGFCDTGVKRIFIIAISPDVQENYTNILKMWVLAQLSSGLTEWNNKYTISTDLKLANIILGLMNHSSLHPCSWCDIQRDELHMQGNTRTLQSLTNAFWKWYSSDGEKKSAKDYGNVIHIPLLKGNPDDSITDILPPPELHLFIGPFNTIYKAMEQEFSNEAAAWAKHCSVERESFHGGHFNGNSCRRLLKTLDYLRSICPIGCLKYVKCLELFKRVVHSCYGYVLDEKYMDHIHEFKTSYLGLGIAVTPKVHAVWYHIPDFCNSVNEGLGRWSEQAAESVHADFKHTWKKYSVSITHPSYCDRLLSAVEEYNGSHL